ncbi:Asp-tRNA(Asn)/Glu-tRNA(Gln) amidotransferase GatCAB subunit B [Candidatus Peregrinibacteria bacterium CG10_big_fil_rev_8_21_14_0_10_36_19]|nr:MAG: Asp-tRNA(Asn)/Glu-tRNA(Gln) amidotransferase GatCAB subunit B [Candidatus Peregrinibacteria bacterium CG10_big_fil_rev_8_21_14_0_10_36_19]
MELEVIIGLEIHAQISSKTKMFCGCDNDSFGKDPNVNICPICTGMPGQLPVVNEEAVHKGVKASLALNCNIPEFCKFDRKNYFYPDSPKGFQISQFDEPLAEKGFVDIEVNGYTKKIGITRLHLEDDAGKLTHVRDGSLVDFNRAGTPLMEIVSDPDMRSAAEAAAYAREVQKILRYVGSSDADMEKGMMRFDASVSMRPVGDDKLYPRAEIKNLNSFRSLEAAIEYEIKKQTELWEKGEALRSPVTVGWDDSSNKTFFMREKEESDDYRYFPEPDIPTLHIGREMVDQYRSEVPEMPVVKRHRYVNELGLSEDDARIISEDPKLAVYFEEVVEKTDDAKRAVSFINTILMAKLNEDILGINNQKVTADLMAELVNLVKSGEISNNTAKGEVFDEMYATGKSPKVIVEEKGLKQVSDAGAIEAVCKSVVDGNPGPVADVKGGNEKAIGFLVGQVMKEMKGQGNPSLINETLRKLIS